MGTISLKTSHSRVAKRMKRFFPALSKTNLFALLILVTLPEIAFAQTYTAGSEFFCYIAQYFRGIVGIAGVIAIIMWGFENFFGSAKFHTLIMSVGITCVVVIGAATFIVKSGLTVNCVLV